MNMVYMRLRSNLFPKRFSSMPFMRELDLDYSS